MPHPALYRAQLSSASTCRRHDSWLVYLKPAVTTGSLTFACRRVQCISKAHLQLPCPMGLHFLTSISETSQTRLCAVQSNDAGGEGADSGSQEQVEAARAPAAAATAHRLRRPRQPPRRQQLEVPNSS